MPRRSLLPPKGKRHRPRVIRLAYERGHFGRVQGGLKRLRVRSNLIGRVINLIRERAEEIKVRPSIEISPGPKNDPFCLCAEQGMADFIVTLNPRDFPEKHLKAKDSSPALLSNAREPGCIKMSGLFDKQGQSRAHAN